VNQCGGGSGSSSVARTNRSPVAPVNAIVMSRRWRSSLIATQLLSRLGLAQREAFVLTQLLGLSYEEAARSLEVPIGTIRSRVARARSELQAEVQRTLAV